MQREGTNTILTIVISVIGPAARPASNWLDLHEDKERTSKHARRHGRSRIILRAAHAVFPPLCTASCQECLRPGQDFYRFPISRRSLIPSAGRYRKGASSTPQ